MKGSSTSVAVGVRGGVDGVVWVGVGDVEKSVASEGGEVVTAVSAIVSERGDSTCVGEVAGREGVDGGVVAAVPFVEGGGEVEVGGGEVEGVGEVERGGRFV